MIIPVGDLNPRRTTPWVNYLLIAANVAAFWYVFTQPEANIHEIVDRHALKPDRWRDLLTFVSSMFLHGGLAHLAGNMLFLYIAGDNVEDRIGHLEYLVFYLLAGLSGAIAHVYWSLEFKPDMASIPTVGASGAISGVMGAYLVFFPASQIRFMLWLILFIRYFTLPAWGALGLWIGSQVLMARAQWDGVAEGETAMVAVFAHLGGFAFGVLFALLLRVFGKPPKKQNRA